MLLRILIVDDQPEMGQLLALYLKPISSCIDWVDNLNAALEKARTGNYNVVILDLKLNTTGKEEAFRAVAEFKHFKAAVVVVSGLPDPHLKEDALAAGADAFVSKGGDFNAHALLLATNIATLKLPHDSYQSDSYLKHVEMLRQMVNAA